MRSTVIHICHGKAKLDKSNGVSKVVNRLATHQCNIGMNAQVWGITKNPKANYEKRNFETLFFRENKPFELIRRIKIELEQLPLDTVFHLHGGFKWEFFLISRLLRRRGFNYVVTLHGSYNKGAMRKSKLKKYAYYHVFDKFMLRGATRIHLIGRSEKEAIEELDQKLVSKSSVLQNGQDLLPVERTSVNNKSIFGFIGRLDMTTKGLDLLIRGFQIHSINNPDAELHIVGDGEDRYVLESMVDELGIEQKVKFHGALYDDDKMNIMNSFDYLCLLSRNEGMPGVVLEALASEIPVVVSKGTNMDQYVIEHDCGLVVDRIDVSVTAEVLQKASQCVRTAKYADMCKASSEMIRKKFSWPYIVSQLNMIYD